MADLVAIFRAGFVRRWHMNPELSHTCDRIDGHESRVARIILALHPDPTVDLLRAALIHDDGESVIGDVKAPTKDGNSALADMLHHAEADAVAAIWGPTCMLIGDEDGRWLRFADRLDAYMWAARHAPHVMDCDGWPEARRWLWAEAHALGLERFVIDRALRVRGEP